MPCVYVAIKTKVVLVGFLCEFYDCDKAPSKVTLLQPPISLIFMIIQPAWKPNTPSAYD